MDFWNALKNATVGALDLRRVPVLSPSASMLEAVRAMREARHGSAVICDGGRVVGIVTERDWLRLLHRRDDPDQPVRNFMTPSPQTVTRDDSLLRAVRLMYEGGYRRLPVVEPDGEPHCPQENACGVVDVKSVTHFLVSHFPREVYNHAPWKQTIPTQPEGA